MSEKQVFLGIGSNMGDRPDNVKLACADLSAFLHRFTQASLYETRPRDVSDQPLYLNTVVSGYCSLTAHELLLRIQEIERRHGRNRSSERRRGPRTIDIDLLLYGREVIKNDDLIVPHPRMTERKFVLIPLLELAPLLSDPRTGLAFQRSLESLSPQGIYYFSATRYSRDTSGVQAQG